MKISGISRASGAGLRRELTTACRRRSRTFSAAVATENSAMTVICPCRSQAPLGNASREALLRIGFNFRFPIHSGHSDSPSGAWQDAFPSGAWERQNSNFFHRFKLSAKNENSPRVVAFDCAAVLLRFRRGEVVGGRASGGAVVFGGVVRRARGDAKAVLPDGTRPDCVLSDAAVEFDFGEGAKPYECAGQARHYGKVSGKRPLCVLIRREGAPLSSFRRAATRVDAPLLCMDSSGKMMDCH